MGEVSCDTVWSDQAFIVGNYSVADMACAPWLYAHQRRGQLDLDGLPHVARWYADVCERPAFLRAYEILAGGAGGPYVANRSMLHAEARRILFGRTRWSSGDRSAQTLAAIAVRASSICSAQSSSHGTDQMDAGVVGRSKPPHRSLPTRSCRQHATRGLAVSEAGRRDRPSLADAGSGLACMAGHR